MTLNESKPRDRKRGVVGTDVDLSRVLEERETRGLEDWVGAAVIGTNGPEATAGGLSLRAESYWLECGGDQRSLMFVDSIIRLYVHTIY